MDKGASVPDQALVNGAASVSTLTGFDPSREVVATFKGDFLVWKRNAHGMRSRVGGNIPRVRHKTMETAIAEAKRLRAQWPDSAFVILQEVAVVKTAIATEARRDETENTGSVHDGAAPQEIAQ